MTSSRDKINGQDLAAILIGGGLIIAGIIYAIGFILEEVGRLVRLHPLLSSFVMLIACWITYVIETNYEGTVGIEERKLRSQFVVAVCAAFLGLIFSYTHGESQIDHDPTIFFVLLGFVFLTYCMAWHRHNLELDIYEPYISVKDKSNIQFSQQENSLLQLLAHEVDNIPEDLLAKNLGEKRRELEEKRRLRSNSELAVRRNGEWVAVWLIIGFCSFFTWMFEWSDPERSPDMSLKIGGVATIALVICGVRRLMHVVSQESLQKEIAKLCSSEAKAAKEWEESRNVAFLLRLAMIFAVYLEFQKASALILDCLSRSSSSATIALVKRCAAFTKKKEKNVMTTRSVDSGNWPPTSGNIRKLGKEIRSLEEEIGRLEDKALRFAEAKYSEHDRERSEVVKSLVSAKRRLQRELAPRHVALKQKQGDYRKEWITFRSNAHRWQADIEALAQLSGISFESIDLETFVDLLHDGEGLEQVKKVRLKMTRAEKAVSIRKEQEQLIKKQQEELAELKQQVFTLETDLSASSGRCQKLDSELAETSAQLQAARRRNRSLSQEVETLGQELREERRVRSDDIANSVMIWKQERTEKTGLAHEQYGVFIAAVAVQLGQQIERGEKPDESAASFDLVAREVIKGKGAPPGNERDYRERFFSSDSFIALKHCNIFRNGVLAYAEKVEQDGWTVGKGDYLHDLVLAFNEKWRVWFREWLFEGYKVETLRPVFGDQLEHEARVAKLPDHIGIQEFLTFLDSRPALFNELVDALDSAQQRKVE